MAKRPRPRRRKKPAARRGSPWLKLFLIALLVIATCGALLDRYVQSRFNPELWSVPGVVYGRPLRLAAGVRLLPDALEAELKRVGYQRVTDIRNAGDYARDGTSFEISLRSFRFWDEVQPEQRVRVRFDGDTITSVRAGSGNDGQQVVRVEPVAIGRFVPTHEQDRILIPLEDVPPLFVQTLIAVEDKHFFRHPGVDPLAVVRAGYANLKAGRVVQGGSTLTQQLVKNLFLERRQTLRRKLAELVLSLMVELRYSKLAILHGYINEVFLGQSGAFAIHGFGTAARYYFNRPLAELEPDQVALLVGLARGASLYDPRRSPQRALKRRNLILGLMHDRGLLPDSNLSELQQKPLGVLPKPPRFASLYPGFMDLVRRQLAVGYSRADLDELGLRIFSTIEPASQRALESAMQQVLPGLERRAGLPDNSLQGAAVVVRRGTGEVVALVHGRDARFPGFNRALDAQRPIGSLAKPAVYLAAIRQRDRFNVLSLVEDRTMPVPASWRDWRPRNYDGRERGPVPMYRALADSLNIATVNLGLAAGEQEVKQAMRDLGFNVPEPWYPAAMLGAMPGTALEMSAAYQAIADGGVSTGPRSIRAITDRHGEALRGFRVRARAGFAPDEAAVLSFLLREVVASGTARGIANSGLGRRRLAGKTGTTDDGRDSWFVGYGRDHVATVWLGSDDNQPTRLSGASGAMRVWTEFMQAIGEGALSSTPVPQVDLFAVDKQRGVRVPESCAEVRMPFLQGGVEPVVYRCR